MRKEIQTGIIAILGNIFMVLMLNNTDNWNGIVYLILMVFSLLKALSMLGGEANG